MSGLLTPVQATAEYKTASLNLDKGRPQMLIGLSGAPRACFVAALVQERGTCALVVTTSEQDARQLVEDLDGLLPGRAELFPASPVPLYQVTAHGREAMAGRLSVLTRPVPEPVVLVASLEAFLRRLPDPRVFRAARLELQVGQSYSPGELMKKLLDLGYERVDKVEAPGQFARRGGILDIYPLTGQHPVRVEFFDEEVDSLRTFSAATQRSLEQHQRVEIGPAAELVLDDAVRDAALERILADYQAQRKKITRSAGSEARQQLEELYGRLRAAVESGVYEPLLEQYSYYFYPQPVSLVDYLSPEALLVFDEPVRLMEAAGALHKERAEVCNHLLGRGKALPAVYRSYLDWEEVQEALTGKPVLYCSALPRQSGVPARYVVNISAKSVPSFMGRLDILVDEVRQWKRRQYGVVLLVGGEERSRALLEELQQARVDAYRVGKLTVPPAPGQVVIAPGTLSAGFELVSARLVVITENELSGHRRRARRAARPRQAGRLEPFTDLKKGDYVVHVNHGIGRYEGIVSMEVAGLRKDYLQIKYAGEDRLYVPVDQVDLVQKYLGADAESPRLSRLGGAEWHRVKSRVKEAVRQMADELLKLYAARETIRGHAFSPDKPWQKEFEDAFPYEETPDQLRAIADVKRDMEKPRPMDRLLCGDVGYGKTEVALRAAFKAVMDGKQVAVLVPTTILAQQHYHTFKERFAPYPVNIELLSRFRSPREQKQVLAGLKSGTVDIVIGTHRLVQGDVQFKDLGLLVVDEEQRFGVAHKERLKLLKQNVDVLTLTATPIPRTLHMSLVGVRDTSLLETPPENRFLVQTYVVEEDPVMIREAISREMSRGGQVFFVHNRVMELDRVASWLQELVPEARIAVAHGQMREDSLEEIIMDFLAGEYDVLLCTTIIESGLDMPNVNTLIVKDADKMGLAQLYQLRGRVGRSNRLAYAYFTYRREKVLSEQAEKRLAAIREFTEFGSGFKIAMRDLEIRGAGNILGAEQHGHIAAVGFDLYCRLLEEAVREARGQTGPAPVETSIELPVEGYIPDEYIPDTNQKIEIYRRLAAAAAPEEVEDIREELWDRFGDPPESVLSLLRVARLKAMAMQLRVRQVGLQAGHFSLHFAPGHNLSGELLVRLGQEYGGRIKFQNLGEEFQIKLRAPLPGSSSGHILDMLEDFLHRLQREAGSAA
ncbi:MAG: transcription-repair coupling factor [Desulfurispora sp.]|uniref:transcription-repair coupling factor n=1 Tax=Desulfurispora sp. TaxID=3014275 RepID=UPI00404ACD3D